MYRRAVVLQRCRKGKGIVLFASPLHPEEGGEEEGPLLLVPVLSSSAMVAYAELVLEFLFMRPLRPSNPLQDNHSFYNRAKEGLLWSLISQ